MKTASVTVRITDKHSVIKHRVTPIEVLLLAAEHKAAAGSDGPIVIDKSSIKDEKEYVSNEVAVVMSKGVEKPVVVPWTEDNELLRLRRHYSPAKLAIFKEVRQLPTDFDDAIRKGTGLESPTTGTAAQPGASVLGKTEIKV
jgi:hypothetical protein